MKGPALRECAPVNLAAGHANGRISPFDDLGHVCVKADVPVAQAGYLVASRARCEGSGKINGGS
jgi:hypothetical protein